MSAEILRRAAALMRERANAGDAQPWKFDEDGGDYIWAEYTLGTTDVAAEVDPKWTPHIASWHPAVALAVAAWLVDTAPLMRCDDCGMAEFHCLESRGIKCCPDCGHGRKALAVARAYLGESA